MTSHPNNPVPTGNATLCVSVASRPSRFGITVHNAGYRFLGLDYFYKALQATEIEPVIRAVRALGIRGCGVSMPFKVKVIPFLDELDEQAAQIGAVNTVVNDGGRLVGYNTDAYGATCALRELGDGCLADVLVLGGGGVARAVLAALQAVGAGRVRVALRQPDKGQELAQSFGVTIIPWENRGDAACSLLINATSVGMAPEADAMPVPESYLDQVGAVMDVVASPAVTRLITAARARGLACVQGDTMTMHQAARQFELYTGHEAPLAEMWRAYKALSA